MGGAWAYGELHKPDPAVADLEAAMKLDKSLGPKLKGEIEKLKASGGW